MTATTRLTLAAIAALALIAALLTVFVGAEDGPSASAVAMAQDEAAEAPPSDPIGDLFGDGDPVSAEGVSVTLSRDPFFPVISGLTDDAGPDGGGSDGGATDGGGTDGGLDGGADGGDGGSGDGGGDTGGVCADPSGTETVCEGVVIALQGFDDQGRALISVGGVTEAGSEGDLVGAGLVEILSINEPQVELRYGDEFFVLGVGEQILK